MIRVLVVDDSAYHRRTLQKIIDADSQMEVVGLATDLTDGVDLAADAIDSGKAAAFLEGFTNHFAGR